MRLLSLFYFVFQNHKWLENWFVFNDLILDFRFVPIQCHISDIFKQRAALLLQIHELLCFLNSYHCIWIMSEKRMNGLFHWWRYTLTLKHQMHFFVAVVVSFRLVFISILCVFLMHCSHILQPIQWKWHSCSGFQCRFYVRNEGMWLHLFLSPFVYGSVHNFNQKLILPLRSHLNGISCGRVERKLIRLHFEKWMGLLCVCVCV